MHRKQAPWSLSMFQRSLIVSCSQHTRDAQDDKICALPHIMSSECPSGRHLCGLGLGLGVPGEISARGTRKTRHESLQSIGLRSLVLRV